MKLFDRFKKKPAVFPVKKEEPKQERKQYTVSEMENICNELYGETVLNIGKGEFKIGFNLLSEKTEIYAVLQLDKNKPMYNSLFRDFFLKHKQCPGIFYNLEYDGLMKYCKEVAEEKGIDVELTEWSVEHIPIDFEKADSYNLWGRQDYILTNKKTLADYAREKCFAW